MSTSRTTSSQPSSRRRPLAIALAGAAVVASLTLAPAASAGVIPAASGWNLGNVTVSLDGTGSSFDPDTGGYDFGPDSDYSYQAEVDNGAGEVLGIVLAKDWPVGEPPGIKIVNDDFAVKQPGRPTNCIMSTSYLDDHFLDSGDPKPVLCSGPFQSHKRFKVAMLPTTVAAGAGAEKGIDLVFNVDPEAGSRDYQVFQKINNWTGGRLEGFTIEVGTGLGTNFVVASDETAGAGVGNLSLSVPADFFRGEQLATFSQGLFGPIDTQHGRPAGFFDQNTRAGFEIAEYPQISGKTATLNSAGPLGSDYGDLFGPWLANDKLPTGIFWDDDGNPATDAQLVAWHGASGWMKGAADNFAPISDETIEEWGQNLEYTVGEIDDLVNVGLNYVVTIGDTASFDSFTIRVTPSVDTSGAGDPAYVGVPVAPPLVFSSSDGVVSITPAPTFPVNGLLTARVGDADLDLDAGAIDTVDVDVAIAGGVEPVVLTLVEQGLDRGVFAATLPDSYSALPAGSVVTATYVDANDGSGGTDVEKSASTTGVDEDAPTASVSITDFSAPDSIFVGQTRKLTVSVTNDAASEIAVSGEVVIKANGDEVYSEAFTDLDPRRKVKVSTKWTAEAEDVGEVEWTVTLVVDGEEVDPSATESTVVSVRANKNNGQG